MERYTRHWRDGPRGFITWYIFDNRDQEVAWEYETYGCNDGDLMLNKMQEVIDNELEP